MAGADDVTAMESNEEEEGYNIAEWKDSGDESEERRMESAAKKSLVHGWLEDFWVEDDATDDSEEAEDDGDDDDEDQGIDVVEEDWSGDEPDLGFLRKTKKKKKKQQDKSSYDAVLGELTVKQTETKKTPEVDDRKELACIRTSAKEKSPSTNSERPPSETVHFTSADDMKLPTRPPSSTRSSASEEEGVDRPKYYYIARELMTSERTYVKGLHLVEKAFHGAIKTYNMLTKEIIPERVVRSIFSNLGEIYQLHQEMLFALEKRMVNWDNNPRIGDILVERAPFFKMYSTYSIQFEGSQATLAEWNRKCHELADIIERVEASPASRAMPITSYMLTPIQRVPRYQLLLEDYIKHLPVDSVDWADTQEALKAVSIAASHMDEQCKKLDNFQKVIKIQRSLIGNDIIVQPGREFVAKGPVQWVDGKKLRPSVLFLFSDVLLVVKSSRQAQYKILCQLQLSGIKVQDRKTGVLPNTFSIIGTQVHLYQANSTEEKMKWIEILGATIDQCTAGRSAESLARTSSMLKGKKMRMALASVDQGVDEADNTELGWKAPALLDTELALESYCQISGYLKKRSAVRDRWCRCWFVVANLRIYSYQHHDDEVPIGFQPLPGCTVSLPDEDDGITRDHVFKLVLVDGLDCFLQTDSQYDLDRWMGVLFVAGMASAESAV